jgi:hypothetical protein
VNFAERCAGFLTRTRDYGWEGFRLHTRLDGQVRGVTGEGSADGQGIMGRAASRRPQAVMCQTLGSRLKVIAAYA